MYFDAYMNSFEKVPNALTYDSKHQRSKVSLEQRKSLIKQYSSASNNSQSNIKDKSQKRKTSSKQTPSQTSIYSNQVH